MFLSLQTLLPRNLLSFHYLQAQFHIWGLVLTITRPKDTSSIREKFKHDVLQNLLSFDNVHQWT